MCSGQTLRETRAIETSDSVLFQKVFALQDAYNTVKAALRLRNHGRAALAAVSPCDIYNNIELIRRFAPYVESQAFRQCYRQPTAHCHRQTTGAAQRSMFSSSAQDSIQSVS